MSKKHRLPEQSTSQAREPVKGASYLVHHPGSGSLSIDMDALPEPGRNFTAQAFRVDRTSPTGATYQLTFGHLLIPHRLSSLVAIHIEEPPLRNFLESCHAEFRNSVDRLSASSNDDLRITDEDIAAVNLDRTWIAKASLARASVSLNGAQVDWYEISPRMLVDVVRGRPVSAVPGVVTTFLSVACLRDVIRDCEKLLGVVPKKDAPG